jgi:hypothetical protein
MIAPTVSPSGDAFHAEAERLVTKWAVPGAEREARIARVASQLSASAQTAAAALVPDRSGPVLHEADRIEAMEIKRGLIADQAAELEAREWRAAHPEDGK